MTFFGFHHTPVILCGATCLLFPLQVSPQNERCIRHPTLLGLAFNWDRIGALSIGTRGTSETHPTIILKSGSMMGMRQKQHQHLRLEHPEIFA